LSRGKMILFVRSSSGNDTFALRFQVHNPKARPAGAKCRAGKAQMCQAAPTWSDEVVAVGVGCNVALPWKLSPIRQVLRVLACALQLLPQHLQHAMCFFAAHAALGEARQLCCVDHCEDVWVGHGRAPLRCGRGRRCCLSRGCCTGGGQPCPSCRVGWATPGGPEGLGSAPLRRSKWSCVRWTRRGGAPLRCGRGMVRRIRARRR
jgi:hypothetical protein